MLERTVTPPEYAKRLGVKPSKVLTWIRHGELRAVNVATNLSGRPRWKIPTNAIVEFEARRAAKPAPTTGTPRRRRRDPQIIKFF